MEEQVRGLRDDVAAMTAELERTRNRLRNLETTTQGLVKIDQASREVAHEQQRKIALRLQYSMAAVAVIAVLSPILTHLTIR